MRQRIVVWSIIIQCKKIIRASHSLEVYFPVIPDRKETGVHMRVNQMRHFKTTSLLYKEDRLDESEFYA